MGEQDQPDDGADHEHGQRRRDGEGRDPDVLRPPTAGSARPARRAGCAANRSPPRPATASPDTTETASGRNSGRVTTSDVKARNSPFSVIWPMNGRPVSVARRRHPHRDAEQDRRQGQHRQQRDVASPAEDQPQLGPHEPRRSRASAGRRGVRRSRRPGVAAPGRRRRGSDAAAPSRRAHSSTSKPSPVSPTKSSSRSGRSTTSWCTGTPARTSAAVTAALSTAAEVGDDLYPCRRARRPRPARSARPRRAPGSPRPAGVVCTRTRVTDAEPEVVQRALEDQAAVAHHADVRAHLLDLAQQVRGHEDRRALRRDLAHQGPHLPGALAGQGRSSARRGRTARAAAAAHRPDRAAAACRGSRRGSACAPPRRARPAPGPPRPAARAWPPGTDRSAASSRIRLSRPDR